jgi:hypothetical protein
VSDDAVDPVDPYRDDRAAARQKPAAALTDYEQMRAQLREIADALDAVNEVERKAGRQVVRADTSAASAIAGAADDAGLGDLVRRTAEIEAATVALRRRRDRLHDLVRRLSGRSQDGITVAPLCAAPRRVPWGAYLIELAPFRIGFTSLMLSPVVGGAIVLSAADLSPAAIALLLGWVCVIWLRARRYLAVLRWGEVAPAIAIGSRTGSTEMTNWPVRRAQGWEVTTEPYTGNSVETTLQYTSKDGHVGELEVSGWPYSGGVVLADSRDPTCAIVVERFRSLPRPDEHGELIVGGVATYANAIIATGAWLVALGYTLYSLAG